MRYSGILKSGSEVKIQVEKDREEARLWLTLNIDTQGKADLCDSLKQEIDHLRSVISSFQEQFATMSIVDQQRLAPPQFFTPTVNSEDFSEARSKFKTQMCKFWPNNTCRRGENCQFAHDADELNP